MDPDLVSNLIKKLNISSFFRLFNLTDHTEIVKFIIISLLLLLGCYQFSRFVLIFCPLGPDPGSQNVTNPIIFFLTMHMQTR